MLNDYRLENENLPFRQKTYENSNELRFQNVYYSICNAFYILFVFHLLFSDYGNRRKHEVRAKIEKITKFLALVKQLFIMENENIKRSSIK